ncbi:MAG: aminopeptidase P family protein [Methanobacteriota archaeon]|nr:MAG: aminopeptidase P family protein [Euryarchaeota archaeon]
MVFSENEFKSREKKVRETIKDLDLVYVFNRPDLFYYSGTGLDGVIEFSEDRSIRLVRRNPDLASQVSQYPVQFMSSYRWFKQRAKDIKIERLGLELDILPYKTVDYIKRAFDSPEIIDISSHLRKIRSVKSSEEIKYMEKSAKLTDESFEHAKNFIRAGMTEMEVSAEIERYLRANGHPGWTQVRTFQHNLVTNAYVMAGESTITLNSMFGPVSGQGSTRLHMVGPSRRKIKNGDPVLIDTTGVVEGYITDVTRTFFVGSVDERIVETYRIAEAVQEKCKILLRKGASPPEIYTDLEQLVRELGYEDRFMGLHSDKVKFIGHGIGLELDEFPIITPSYTDPLESGNTIAIEPKLMIPELKTGVGIEDSWLVTDQGGHQLSNFPYFTQI